MGAQGRAPSVLVVPCPGVVVAEASALAAGQGTQQPIACSEDLRNYLLPLLACGGACITCTASLSQRYLISMSIFGLG